MPIPILLNPWLTSDEDWYTSTQRIGAPNPFLRYIEWHFADDDWKRLHPIKVTRTFDPYAWSGFAPKPEFWKELERLCWDKIGKPQ